MGCSYGKLVWLENSLSRPSRPRTQHDYHHDTKVKPEAATAVIELLMMGGKTPETRWAVNKRQDNKLKNCCICWWFIWIEKSAWCTIFLIMFVSFLYMFRATVCPSSGEITVSMGHSVLATLHTRQSSIQTDKYQVSHRCSYFSWWWTHSRPKHVEKRNKHNKKNCAPSWFYLHDYTGMHGQQNIKYGTVILYYIEF